MRIGIDVSPAIRRYKTGTEWYTYNLIEALKKVDLTNHFFLLYSPIPLSAELAQLPARWQNKVLPWPFKYLWTQIRLSLEMLFNQPDVLFVPAHAIPLIHPKKVITTIHDLGFERFPEAYTRWQRFYYRFAHRFAAEHATKIIVPSEFTKRELINLYNVSSEKIVVVPLGYDSNIFKV
ncbi:MAG: glycosyltransferase, partial [Patescibacteria group bacterium]